MTPPAAMMGTVSRLADALRSQTTAAVVVVGALRSDVTATKSSELSARYGSLLAGALGGGTRVGKSPSSLETARVSAGSSQQIVYVELEIANGEFRVSADLYPIPHNIWDRCRNPIPGAISHQYATARLDAELRSYLSPVPLVALRAEKATLDDADVVALGCADVDADGALEVVCLSRRNVSIGRVRQGKFQALRRVAWTDLSPIAPAPWRQPMGSIGLPSQGTIDIGVTDRTRALRLDADLRIRTRLDGIPALAPAGRVCARAHPTSLFDRLIPCTATDPVGASRDPGFAFDASASDQVIGTDGSVSDVWVVRDPTDGKGSLRDGKSRSAGLGRIGAQVAVADIDLDGQPEAITTRDVLEERDDAIVVRTWLSSGALRDRVSLPVPTGVSAIGVCPSDGPGIRPIVLASRSELWVLR